MFALLSVLVAAEVKQRTAEDLIHPHPVWPDGNIPKISEHGCYKPVSGTADKRLEPYDFDGEKHGFELVAEEDLPVEFDIRNVNGKNLASPDIQQHMPVYCGGCWAYGTTATISDRFKMLREGAWPEVTLNVQSLLNCGKSAGTCFQGGTDALVYRFAKEFGYTDSTCTPVFGQSLPCTDITRCMNCDPPAPLDGFPHGMCYPQQRYKTYHVKAYSHLPVDDPSTSPNMIVQMKSEIYARGPISCQIAAGPMEQYISGVLNTPPGESGEIDHVVSVSGWGTDPSTGSDYWIVRNSWGTHWGELGWFRVEMYHNALNLESGCTFGIPEWPPRVYEVPAERMFFTNGLYFEVPEWLQESESSPWFYQDGHDADKGFLDEKDRQQRENFERVTSVQGTSHVYNKETMQWSIKDAPERVAIAKQILGYKNTNPNNSEEL